MSRADTKTRLLPAGPAPREHPIPRADAEQLRFRVEIGDIAVCLLFLAVAAWFYVTAANIPDYSGTFIGPDDFPRGLALIFAGFSLALLGRAVLLLLKGGYDGEWVLVERPLRVAAGMVLLALFPFLMEHIGFYIAMALWLPAFFVVADYTRPITVIVCTATFIAFTKVVFEMLLGTPIP